MFLSQGETVLFVERMNGWMDRSQRFYKFIPAYSFAHHYKNGVVPCYGAQNFKIIFAVDQNGNGIGIAWQCFDYGHITGKINA